MEKFKDPAMLVALMDFLAIAGTSVYFNKELEKFRTDRQKDTQTLTSLSRQMGEMFKSSQGYMEELSHIKEDVKEIKEQLNELPSAQDMQDLDQDLDEIVSAMNEADIPVDRPSKRRSGDRRYPSHKEDFEDKRKPMRAPKPTPRPQTRPYERQQRYEQPPHTRSYEHPPSTRSYEPPVSRSYELPNRAPKPSMHTNPPQSYDDIDETELINSIRVNQLS